MSKTEVIKTNDNKERRQPKRKRSFRGLILIVVTLLIAIGVIELYFVDHSKPTETSPPTVDSTPIDDSTPIFQTNRTKEIAAPQSVSAYFAGADFDGYEYEDTDLIVTGVFHPDALKSFVDIWTLDQQWTTFNCDEVSSDNTCAIRVSDLMEDYDLPSGYELKVRVVH